VFTQPLAGFEFQCARKSLMAADTTLATLSNSLPQPIGPQYQDWPVIFTRLSRVEISGTMCATVLCGSRRSELNVEGHKL
jgi:hypothetical protein